MAKSAILEYILYSLSLIAAILQISSLSEHRYTEKKSNTLYSYYLWTTQTVEHCRIFKLFPSKSSCCKTRVMLFFKMYLKLWNTVEYLHYKNPWSCQLLWLGVEDFFCFVLLDKIPLQTPLSVFYWDVGILPPFVNGVISKVLCYCSLPASHF